MKVDFPQPESAATPITIGVWPGSKAMLSWLLEAGARIGVAGAKAEADAMNAVERMNFMVYV